MLDGFCRAGCVIVDRAPLSFVSGTFVKKFILYADRWYDLKYGELMVAVGITPKYDHINWSEMSFA